MGNKAIQATIGGEIIENKKINLLDKIFEIPAYQRLYEWEKDEIETLLDDMKKAYNEGKGQYFIGNITTSIDKNDSNKFILIDGQQRLTTLWFIGFYLASKGCDEWKEFITQDEKVRIAMSIRDNEENALKELAMKIQNDTIKPNENSEINLYTYLPSDIHQKIINAFECIEKWFNAMFGKYTNGKLEIDLKQLKCFSLFIYRRVCFVFVELAENTDLNRFFVRMNNRGKQLEKHEILKARILDKIKDDKSDEWQKYAKIWDLCSDMSKYIFQSKDSEIYKVESIIDFPTFLLHCFKIFMVDNLPENFTISKDKLLEFIDIKKLTWEDKNCKEFIESMLRYRVLFDSFVIKFTAKKGKEANKKESPYEIKRLDSDDNLVNSNLNDLEMIQNYLRVARRGENRNYEHWLTYFLRFLDSENDFNELKAFAIVNNFYNTDKLNPPQCLIKQENESKETKQENEKKEIKLVKFLENIDTEQIFKVNLKDKKINEISVDFLKTYLSKSTGTPHYWFYRLEYYLWKWGKLNDKDFETQCKEKFGDRFNDLKSMFSAELGTHNFKFIAKNFYFRNLNSVEHFHPQRLKSENGWETYIDYFGNLALISSSTNSQYSDQLPKDKKEDLKNKLNKKGGNTESLKFFLMCAQCKLDNNEWNYNNNVKDRHEKYMLDILIESLRLMGGIVVAG